MRVMIWEDGQHVSPPPHPLFLSSSLFEMNFDFAPLNIHHRLAGEVSDVLSGWILWGTVTASFPHIQTTWGYQGESHCRSEKDPFKGTSLIIASQLMSLYVTD